jgi:hypothetical protein
MAFPSPSIRMQVVSLHLMIGLGPSGLERRRETVGVCPMALRVRSGCVVLDGKMMGR